MHTYPAISREEGRSFHFPEPAVWAANHEQRANSSMPVSGHHISDEEILRLIGAPGSREEGFRALLARYQEPLYRHIRRLIWPHEDANDVLQNCLLKVYRGIDRFEGKSKLYTWLYRIATNEAITWLKQQKRRRTGSLDGEHHLQAAQLEADPYFDGDAAQLHLQRALSRLPDKQRAVFNLRYFEELPYREMAAILDTSVGALKASYHHAVKKIERYFREVKI